jgi:RNA polymerase sigma-70 factor, ECF subfamily
MTKSRTPVLPRTASAREKPHPRAPKKALISRRSALFFIRGMQTSQIAPFFPSPKPTFWPSVVIIRHTSRLYWRQTREATTQSAVKEHEVVTQPNEFSRIFEAHHGMVFRTAYRITGNAADAEDVLQTIFLRMLRQAPSDSALTQEESYLRRAAVNASLDIIRQRQASRNVPLNEATAQPAQPKAGTGLEDCLRRALENLTERSAEIFALRYFEDFSNPQIAGALNISQVLVAVSLHRTRRQLQKEIRTCMGDGK